MEGTETKTGNPRGRGAMGGWWSQFVHLTLWCEWDICVEVTSRW